MEVARLALVALVTALLCFPTCSQYASGSGEESSNQTTLEEGFVITNVDSKLRGKEYKLDANIAVVIPLQITDYQNCIDFHSCPAVANYVTENTEAYYSLTQLCYNPLYIHQGHVDPYLCQILKRASTCGLFVPNPLPSCD